MRSEFTPDRHSHPPQQADHRSTFRDFANLGSFAEAELPQPNAFWTIRTNLYDTEALSAPGAGEREATVGKARRHAWRGNLCLFEILSQLNFGASATWRMQHNFVRGQASNPLGALLYLASLMMDNLNTRDAEPVLHDSRGSCFDLIAFPLRAATKISQQKLKTVMDASLQFGSLGRVQESLPLGKEMIVAGHDVCIKMAFSRAIDLRRARRTWFSLMAVLFIGLIASCAPKDRQVSTPRDPGPSKVPVHLGVGDVVRLTFPATPELNQSHKVRTDGKISAPLIGEVDAAGKRLASFQEELANLYKAQLTSNEVLVTLESSPVPVYVSGAVSKPGKVILDRPMTVLEAIMEAGGFGPMANMRKVQIIRLTKGEHHTVNVDLKPVMTGQKSRADYVRADDVIYVPEKAVNF